eukprot:scaffold128325_cov39-Phaeocystis_antarctica.AAC.1
MVGGRLVGGSEAELLQREPAAEQHVPRRRVEARWHLSKARPNTPAWGSSPVWHTAARVGVRARLGLELGLGLWLGLGLERHAGAARPSSSAAPARHTPRAEQPAARAAGSAMLPGWG